MISSIEQNTFITRNPPERNSARKFCERDSAAAFEAEKSVPEFQPGDTVKVNVKVIEGSRERVQAFFSKPAARPAQLDDFAAACFYFGEALADLLGGAKRAVPLGLVATAIGGSMIEEWVSEPTAKGCGRADVAEHNAMLWAQNVLPFVDMSVSGCVQGSRA